MHRLPSPPLMANFSPFSSAASNTGSRAHSISSDPESWSRHSTSTMSQQTQNYGTSPENPWIFQPSTRRAFPSPFDSIDQVAAAKPLKQSWSDFDYHIPVSSGKYEPFPGPDFPFESIKSDPAPAPAPVYREFDHPARLPPTALSQDYDFGKRLDDAEIFAEASTRSAIEKSKSSTRHRSQRRPSNRDEFDGPHQYLKPPPGHEIAAQARELPHLPTNLDVSEQDHILNSVNDRLSKCAYDFIAKYQFPVPVEADKRTVNCATDREWTEWVYLLKRLATKRRIPARLLYNGQIKQLVTVLENSLEMRHAAKHQSRPIKDDRNVLQLISAGTQVAKILKDCCAMEFMDSLYIDTERLIHQRKSRRVKFAP
ncbi:uncharacterized protein ACHE_11365A [Aspergillus chevalieri]|uniref:Uncharacterized protein n=1 Tax=Aspergillus chevalieri TaxID=182096 RepID=A0A7R7VHK8_ASPCH|nr:uncharacterized protein ACHE_11365A [Aspergillus chevalieri]BCR83963.1 hypothetical protein ACHE_11365A [Aspergillus chevalieri]